MFNDMRKQETSITDKGTERKTQITDEYTALLEKLDADAKKLGVSSEETKEELSEEAADKLEKINQDKILAEKRLRDEIQSINTATANELAQYTNTEEYKDASANSIDAQYQLRVGKKFIPDDKKYWSHITVSYALQDLRTAWQSLKDIPTIFLKHSVVSYTYSHSNQANYGIIDIHKFEIVHYHPYTLQLIQPQVVDNLKVRTVSLVNRHIANNLLFRFKNSLINNVANMIKVSDMFERTKLTDHAIQYIRDHGRLVFADTRKKPHGDVIATSMVTPHMAITTPILASTPETHAPQSETPAPQPIPPPPETPAPAPAPAPAPMKRQPTIDTFYAKRKSSPEENTDTENDKRSKTLGGYNKRASTSKPPHYTSKHKKRPRKHATKRVKKRVLKKTTRKHKRIQKHKSRKSKA
jgi:hypothetical protein